MYIRFVSIGWCSISFRPVFWLLCADGFNGVSGMTFPIVFILLELSVVSRTRGMRGSTSAFSAGPQCRRADSSLTLGVNFPGFKMWHVLELILLRFLRAVRFPLRVHRLISYSYKQNKTKTNKKKGGGNQESKQRPPNLHPPPPPREKTKQNKSKTQQQQSPPPPKEALTPPDLKLSCRVGDGSRQSR